MFPICSFSHFLVTCDINYTCRHDNVIESENQILLFPLFHVDYSCSSASYSVSVVFDCKLPFYLHSDLLTGLPPYGFTFLRISLISLVPFDLHARSTIFVVVFIHLLTFWALRMLSIVYLYFTLIPCCMDLRITIFNSMGLSEFNFSSVGVEFFVLSILIISLIFFFVWYFLRSFCNGFERPFRVTQSKASSQVHKAYVCQISIFS